MAIITFDPDDLIEYMPEYGDNRSSEDPCVVFLKFVPASRVEKYRQMIRKKNKGTTDYAKMGEVNSEVQEKQFCDSIDRIEGYRNNKGVVITTPEELYKSAPEALKKELIIAMEDSQTLNEGQAKNFKRASDGNSEHETEAHLSVAPAQSETGKTEIAETEKGSPKAQES